MFFNIIANKKTKLAKRLIVLAQYARLRLSTYISWKNRFANVFSLHPEYGNRDSRNTERQHRNIWRNFRNKANIRTYRICKNISGISNPNIIPEEVYATDIEPTLNRLPHLGFLEIKSIYNHWYNEDVFPKAYLHNVDGVLFDINLKLLTQDEVQKIVEALPFPVVFKPNIDSYGGKGVEFPRNPEDLLQLMAKRNDFVVQEKIEQHVYFYKFNTYGLNTIRVCLYRSVKDNNIHVLNMALRMGKDGSLDNESAGGIVSFINPDGLLNGFAVDKFGKKYYHHPDTKEKFGNRIPYVNDLRSLSTRIAERTFFARVISLDMALDKDNKWRAIEINLKGQTIRFSQYAGYPFFGKYTDEVVEYCKTNHWALT